MSSLATNPLSSVFKLKRLNIYFCDLGGSSKGVREIIQPNGYLYQFAQQNPQIEFYCQLKRGDHPRIEAEYENGRTLSHSVRNKNAEQMARKLFELRISAASKISSAQKGKMNAAHTQAESVQGEWNTLLWAALKQHRKDTQKKVRKEMEML